MAWQGRTKEAESIQQISNDQDDKIPELPTDKDSKKNKTYEIMWTAFRQKSTQKFTKFIVPYECSKMLLN